MGMTISRWAKINSASRNLLLRRYVGEVRGMHWPLTIMRHDVSVALAWLLLTCCRPTRKGVLWVGGDVLFGTSINCLFGLVNDSVSAKHVRLRDMFRTTTADRIHGVSQNKQEA